MTPALITEVPTLTWGRHPSAGERVALVPTMGYLHAGHQALMRAARQRADRVLVSIFVNPLQFGPAEDFARYPRDLERDRASCAEAGVDAIFYPEAAAIYPPGFQTGIEVAELAHRLEGAARPGHFRGVATVVYRLFQLLQPSVALFGEKDWQQLKVVTRMVRDLGLPVEVIGHPIVREADGLALSSRNSYLSPDERQRATAIHRGLQDARSAFARGEREPARLCARVALAIDQGGLAVDYIELCDPDTLNPVSVAAPPSRLLVAASLGRTRLIDNAQVG